jgi:hypothetical protein
MITAETTVGRIVDEWADRLARGEPLAADHALAQYPELAGQLRLMLSALGAVAGVRADASLPALAGFHVLREIGRGGMGVVYEAEDETLGRRVAVKVLPPHLTGRPDHLARFRQEARAAAGLHHTHIVPVFGVGESGGSHYIVMQFIPGRPPESGVALPATAVAAMGAKLADALAFAHAHGVLHRDVKPGNVLVDAAGEPWLADFGLARVESADALTDPDGFVGTLRYAAPERFAGASDARSDVYALGLTLYELAAGRPSYDAADRAELMRQVMDASPPRPRAVNPAIPRDLETVILKATAAKPEHRYATAAALADDLRRVLDGRPILAKRIGPLGRLRRWAGRHPVVAGLAASLLVAVSLGVGGVVWQWRQAVANLKTAEDNAEAARTSNERTMSSVRAFYRGMDRMDDFMSFSVPAKPEQQAQRDRKWESFQPVLAVYDDFLNEPSDDPEVLELQTRATVQLAKFLLRFRKLDESHAAVRRALVLAERCPPDAELEAALFATWGLVIAQLKDTSAWDGEFAQVRAYYARHPDSFDRRREWAIILYSQAVGPTLKENPPVARAAIREAMPLLQEANAMMVATPPGSTRLNGIVELYAQLCFDDDDVAAVARLAERRAEIGEWNAAAMLWAKCHTCGTADAEEYAAKAVVALDRYLIQHPAHLVGAGTYADLKPLATRVDMRVMMAKHFGIKQQQEQAARDRARAKAPATERTK